ncbi:MAG: GMC family oxidoreductase [Crocinitomicaceae bacterium]|nr:GMC family oxidoreductase [Crocinitomicaceae bacterium]
MKYDVCIIGSGAGAGPVIYELALAGFEVLVLEKGPWFKTEHFTKDEMTATRRAIYTPAFKDEFHVLETQNANGEWTAMPTHESRRDFWNGSAVGGSSNFMSAYFHRMKPNDFILATTFEKIEGSNIENWPITYDELEPYYTKVEQVVGVSGKVIQHKFLEPRSSEDFIFPPLETNKIADWFSAAALKKGYEMIPAPRGIISQPHEDRNACYLSNYCGSFGCSSDGKSSSRAALINPALKTGRVQVMADSKVFHLETDSENRIVKAWYYTLNGEKKSAEAKLFVVAAQAIETCRLLLMSKNPSCPNGLSNNSGQVGKNLLFSAIGTGSGNIQFEDFATEKIAEINNPMTFVNRAIQQFYEINQPGTGKKIKGGTIDFLLEHSNPMPKSIRLKKEDGKLVYGSEFKRKLQVYFTEQKRVRFEVFCDWIPHDDCYVALDSEYKDKWGDPVARVRLGYHPANREPGNFLVEIGKEILTEMGAKNVSGGTTSSPPENLQAGGCRFGNDPKKSVLDKNCKSHEVPNLYITDGSFMPTGGSVPYTFTIYANAFRVAEKIKLHLQNIH